MKGDQVVLGDFLVTVLKADNRRIRQLHFKVVAPDAGGNNSVTVRVSRYRPIIAKFGPLSYLLIMHDQAIHPRVQKMRAEIEQWGETLLEPGELRLLCRGENHGAQPWNAIAEIAITEGWSFTFFPDDSVRFAKM